MNKDCGIPLSNLRVDGGMTQSDLMMQLQADVLGMDVGMYCVFSRVNHFIYREITRLPFIECSCHYLYVVRPNNPETSCLGAALVAGMADGVGIWNPRTICLKTDSTLFSSTTSHDGRAPFLFPGLVEISSSQTTDQTSYFF